MEDCIFCKVITKQIPSTVVYEDDVVLAFQDIHPVAKVHVLVVPKKHVADFTEIEEPMLMAVNKALQSLITENKLIGNGYRIVTNGGGAQLVNHLHFHLVGPITKTRKI